MSKWAFSAFYYYCYRSALLAVYGTAREIGNGNSTITFVLASGYAR